MRLELQADCLAGVWGHTARASLSITDEDLREALTAAHNIGDDALGHRNTATFTHGSSQQRMRWFKQGFDSGDARRCDTFAARPASSDGRIFAIGAGRPGFPAVVVVLTFRDHGRGRDRARLARPRLSGGAICRRTSSMSSAFTFPISSSSASPGTNAGAREDQDLIKRNTISVGINWIPNVPASSG